MGDWRVARRWGWSGGSCLVVTVVADGFPLAAGRGAAEGDWNDSHIFNERWSAHARFHAVTALAMTATLSSANIWSLGSGGSGQPRERFSRPPFRSLTGRRSSWSQWCPALRSMIRRTQSSVWQACRSACWARRPPPPQPPLAGSSSAPSRSDEGESAQRAWMYMQLNKSIIRCNLELRNEPPR